MGKKVVEIVVVMDRSGSMSSIRDDAIGGFNTFLKEQQGLRGKANLTLVLFDHEYTTPVDSVPIKDVPPLDEETYAPCGMTAMNDAIGWALHKLHCQNPKKAIICIVTDGFENASKEYSTANVKALIEEAEGKGWEVVFLAANQDAVLTGSAIGVGAQNAVNFAASGAGVTEAYASISMRSTSYRS